MEDSPGQLGQQRLDVCVPITDGICLAWRLKVGFFSLLISAATACGYPRL